VTFEARRDADRPGWVGEFGCVEKIEIFGFRPELHPERAPDALMNRLRQPVKER